MTTSHGGLLSAPVSPASKLARNTTTPTWGEPPATTPVLHNAAAMWTSRARTRNAATTSTPKERQADELPLPPHMTPSHGPATARRPCATHEHQRPPTHVRQNNRPRPNAQTPEHQRRNPNAPMPRYTNARKRERATPQCQRTRTQQHPRPRHER